jgi:hypothetical protein
MIFEMSSSHKDPQDAKSSVRLQTFLFKLGFNGYLAEYTKSPGVDLWKEKIIPAIENSLGTIVLFTRAYLKNGTCTLI